MILSGAFTLQHSGAFSWFKYNIVYATDYSNLAQYNLKLVRVDAWLANARVDILIPIIFT